MWINHSLFVLFFLFIPAYIHGIKSQILGACYNKTPDTYQQDYVPFGKGNVITLAPKEQAQKKLWTNTMIYSVVCLIYIQYKTGQFQLMLTHMPLGDDSLESIHAPTIAQLMQQKPRIKPTQESTEEIFDNPLDIRMTTIVPTSMERHDFVGKLRTCWQHHLQQDYKTSITQYMRYQEYDITSHNPGGASLIAVLEPTQSYCHIVNPEKIVQLYPNQHYFAWPQDTPLSPYSPPKIECVLI